MGAANSYEQQAWARTRTHVHIIPADGTQASTKSAMHASFLYRGASPRYGMLKTWELFVSGCGRAGACCGSFECRITAIGHKRSLMHLNHAGLGNFGFSSNEWRQIPPGRVVVNCLTIRLLRLSLSDCFAIGSSYFWMRSDFRLNLR
jgi:hypothetical protein